MEAFLVGATGGTTVLGDYDDFNQISEICTELKLSRRDSYILGKI